MDKKFLGAVALALVLFFCLSITDAYAFERGMSKRCWWDKAKTHHEDLENKFIHKAGFILKKSDELDLSDEQVKKIKDLKIAVKKDMIKKKAEIETIALDIKAKMWEDKIDTAEIDKLIDKKYDIKKEKTKSLVAAYASLEGILTKEQKEKMKGLHKKCKEGKARD